MRILIVANGYPPTAYGGVEVYSSDVARSVASKADDAAIVLCAEHRDDLADYQVIRDRDDGVLLFRIVNDFKHTTSFAQTYADHQVDDLVTEIIEKVSPDIVHINHVIALSANIPSVVAGFGIPIIYTFHDFWPLCQRVNLVDWRGQRCPGPKQGGDCYRCLTHGTILQRIRTLAVDWARSIVPYGVRSAFRRMLADGTAAAPDLRPSPESLGERFKLFRSVILQADRILVPSRFVRDLYVANGYPESLIRVLPLGMRTPESVEVRASKSGQRVLRVGYVGSLLPIKGVDTLLRAFRRIKSDRISLQIYGRADIMPRYSRRLRWMGFLDRRVSFKGSFDPANKDLVYGNLDLLVVPSRAPETFSFVAREALVRGVPVVAANVGALKEIVQHNRNGWLFKPGDVAELATILNRIAQNPDILNSLDLLNDFQVMSVSDHMTELLSIYAEVAR